MSDTPPTDETPSSPDAERGNETAPAPEPTSGRLADNDAIEPVSQEPTHEAEPAPPPVASHDPVEREPSASPVQLPRIFSLLALIASIFALGGLMATYNYFDERLRSTEIGAQTSQRILETKVSAVSGELTKEIAANRGVGARAVVIGGELTRTLYLMNALAEDPALPANARAKARTAYDQTSALLVDLQKLE